jgi:ribosomal protein S18 acetylase RimI-like enzyme
VTEVARIEIRRIRAEDGPLLRDLRLRSLADAPEAFGEPLEDARRRPGTEWATQARHTSHGDQRTWLIAEQDGATVGLVQGRKRRPGTLLLFSMWVDPAARRQGIGRILIEALETWAGSWNARRTVLWVYSGNRAAITFYEGMGFEVIEEGPDAESGAGFRALAMARDIHSSPRWTPAEGR